MYANLLAISPALRAACLDWKAIQRKRVEFGYEWAPAEENARRDRATIKPARGQSL